MHTNDRICVVDIGSNSVRVLVASICDGNISREYSSINTTRLYEGISYDSDLSTSSMERTVNAVHEYIVQARGMGASDCYLFATAAVRVARNRQTFLDMIELATGLEVDVVDEQREALLAFAGVGYDGLCGIIDIGGASSEIAIGDDGHVLASDSMRLGAVKCKELIGSDNGDDIIETVAELLVVDKYRTLHERSRQYVDIKWYGVGGTITTMAAILAQLSVYDGRVVNKTCIKYDEVIKAINSIRVMPIQQRKSIAGLDEKRVDIIVFGLSILANIMKDFDIDDLYASDNGNMIGYILLKIKENKV